MDNFTEFPIHTIYIADYSCEPSDCADTMTVYLSAQLPCMEWRSGCLVTLGEIIGGDRGPLPVSIFIDAYGRGWRRDYLLGLSDERPDALVRTSQKPGDLMFISSAKYPDEPSRAIPGCS